MKLWEFSSRSGNFSLVKENKFDWAILDETTQEKKIYKWIGKVFLDFIKLSHNNDGLFLESSNDLENYLMIDPRKIMSRIHQHEHIHSMFEIINHYPFSCVHGDLLNVSIFSNIRSQHILNIDLTRSKPFLDILDIGFDMAHIFSIMTGQMDQDDETLRAISCIAQSEARYVRHNDHFGHSGIAQAFQIIKQCIEDADLEVFFNNTSKVMTLAKSDYSSHHFFPVIEEEIEKLDNYYAALDFLESYIKRDEYSPVASLLYLIKRFLIKNAEDIES